MKILLVNTSDKTGGAAVAANRLKHALQGEGADVSMLVCDKLSAAQDVHCLASGLLGRGLRMARKAFERLWLLPTLRFSRHNLWTIDEGRCGYDITRTEAFRQADVIHLHWINQGMMSLQDINKVLKSGKRVVWTMHDLWSATALCHYAAECTKFHTECHHCPLLPSGGSTHDLSAKVWQRKVRMYASGKVSFVCCSEWLAGQARQSALIKDQEIVSIPNPIDTSKFHPIDKGVARRALGLPEEGKIILFVSQRVTDERKGVRYFIEAINSIANAHLSTSNIQHSTSNISVAILGGASEAIKVLLNVPCFSLGYITDEPTIINAYNAADCFCLPSLQDNLPNTVMEAMACGVPCVGFNIGGVPEMIDHELNGYIATPRDSHDLARGISYSLSEEHHARLSQGCLAKVDRTYSEHAVAQRFLELYKNKE